MANSYVTNLYPKPTSGIKLRKMDVDSTSAAHSLINSVASGTVLSDGTTAGAFDSLTRYVVIDVQDADAFVTYDGSTPSATYGHRLYAGRSYTWSKQAATVAIFVATGSTTSVIQASEFTD
tara:strand:+ start:199 stop:561 length:363 start_codon:yes stop_codon:yes gene_type:complete